MRNGDPNCKVNTTGILPNEKSSVGFSSRGTPQDRRLKDRQEATTWRRLPPLSIYVTLKRNRERRIIITSWWHAIRAKVSPLFRVYLRSDLVTVGSCTKELARIRLCIRRISMQVYGFRTNVAKALVQILHGSLEATYLGHQYFP